MTTSTASGGTSADSTMPTVPSSRPASLRRQLGTVRMLGQHRLGEHSCRRQLHALGHGHGAGRLAPPGGVAHRPRRARAPPARATSTTAPNPGAGTVSPVAASWSGTPCRPRNVVTSGFVVVAPTDRSTVATSSARALQRWREHHDGGVDRLVRRASRAARAPSRPAPRRRRRPRAARATIPRRRRHSSPTDPRAVELPTTAMRSPGGSGCEVSSSATSNRSLTVSTRITPDRSNSARAASSGNGTRRGRETGHERARAAVHRDDRLAPAEPARQPRELAWVAEGLEVHQHDVGALVGLPELEQVVARTRRRGCRRTRRSRHRGRGAPPRRGSRRPARRTGRRSPLVPAAVAPVRATR